MFFVRFSVILVVELFPSCSTCSLKSFHIPLRSRWLGSADFSPWMEGVLHSSMEINGWVSYQNTFVGWFNHELVFWIWWDATPFVLSRSSRRVGHLCWPRRRLQLIQVPWKWVWRILDHQMLGIPRPKTLSPRKSLKPNRTKPKNLKTPQTPKPSTPLTTKRLEDLKSLY